MPYHPKPIDTSNVQLRPDVLKLVEVLAKNAHERWAKQRLTEGWVFGPQRDDQLKRHPDLVPYEELPDSEKSYDRELVTETLKHLVTLGYDLVPSGDGDKGEASSARRVIPVFPDEPDFTKHDFTTLVGLWRARPSGEWPRSLQRQQDLARRFLSLGEPLIAYDVVEEGQKRWADDVGLRQLEARALIRSGARRAGIDILKELKRERNLDEETLGLLASAYKERYLQASGGEAKQRFLAQAETEYQYAYDVTAGYWTGINAATMSFLRDNTDEAVRLARDVRDHCVEELSSHGTEMGEEAYWLFATVGEASLILEEWKQAEDAYSAAAAVGARRYGDISTTRRNARLILQHHGRESEAIERCLKVPAVVVFSGHMVDSPGRPVGRFPPELREPVRDAIAEWLRGRHIGWGFASAACGSDLLFLESILDKKAKAHVVLPFDEDQLRRENRERSGREWDDSFDYVLDQAAEKIQASDYPFAKSVESYHYANLLLYGLARLRAAQLDTELLTLAVWDRKDVNLPGGTASCVKYWSEMGHDVEVIDLQEIRSSLDPSAEVDSPAGTRSSASSSSNSPTIRTMAVLFADAVGFSRLKENQIRLFFRHFLGEIAERLKAVSNTPELHNVPSTPQLIQTAGDGLYMVFEDLRAAGFFALELTDAVREVDWASRGLPPGLSLRTAIHVGPICSFRNPITRRIDYTGSHTVRAARLEPRTPKGEVYVTQAFAALAVSKNVSGFTCDYVGRIPFAKDYGVHPIYRLRRS